MAYRNKTYVCFDGDTDIHYYRLMKAWKANDNIEFNFYDAHDLHQCRDSSKEETIKRSLYERLTLAKVFLVLLGEHTQYLRKFVRWEMEKALELKIPTVVVNLNKKRSYDKDRCPVILYNNLSVHISYEQAIIQYAIDNWPNSHWWYINNSKGKSPIGLGSYHYLADTYKNVGL